MDILKQLINLMLEKVEIIPVSQESLDNFLLQRRLKISKEHYQFLLNYGNSPFLKKEHANLTFNGFKSFYLNLVYNYTNDMTLPKECDYLGTDFLSETICLSREDKKIYYFDSGETDGIYYEGIQELLFYYLFKSINRNSFERVESSIQITDVEQFKQKNLNYEIKNIFIYERFFFRENQLFVCDDNFLEYSIYKGGILNRVVSVVD